MITCPECDKEFENLKKLIHHFSNDGVHPYIRDYFKIESGYYNPCTGRKYNSYVGFRHSWNNCPLSMSEYFLRNFGSLPNQEAERGDWNNT
jgi:hypothetical protein